MRKTNLIFLSLCLVMLCSCGKSNDNVLLEKNGERYELSQNNSFYYPKGFKMNLDSELKDNISFVNEKEVIRYYKIVNNDDNLLEDLPLLYEGDLEQNGACNVSYVEKIIDSGLKCYEYVGVYEKSGIYFKHIVYFNTYASHVLSYEAPKEVFDKNIDEISLYLNSLVISQ